MAMTALPLRVRQTHCGHIPPLLMLRMAILGLLLVTGLIMTGCGSGDEGGPSASATLTWDPVDDVHGYYVYYGTEPQGSSGSCSYPNKVFTSTPSAIVAGLAPNTTYYFAVSAFNGMESECSAEHPSDSGDIDPVVIG
ncbi:MAG TPA: fibronectin type III domain-containing protein [Nitrospira sp.]|nr:fibronectin type III domain-containing protein [Nitrospira sp.]